MGAPWERRTHISIKSNKSLLAFVLLNNLRRKIPGTCKGACHAGMADIFLRKTRRITHMGKTVNRIYHAAIYV